MKCINPRERFRISFYDFFPHEYVFDTYQSYTQLPIRSNGAASCLLTILEGHAEIVYGDKKWSLVPGEILYVPIICSYTINFYGEPKIVYRTVHFNIHRLSHFDSQQKYAVQKITPENPKEFIEQLLSVYNIIMKEGSFMKAFAAFLPLFDEIKDNLLREEMTRAELAVNPAIKYIEENYAGKISDAQLAEVCHLSVSRFHVLFKEATTLTPMQYKNSMALAHAAAMLKNEKSMSIEEIADACGFTSPSFFRRIFLRDFKKTPREFRRGTNEPNI